MTPAGPVNARATTEELRAAFSRPAIETMVHRFYEVARGDPLLGPVFESRVRDWDLHLERMTLFWRSVLRAERCFQPREAGGPVSLHRGIEELEPRHFQRWLDLFARTCHDILPREAAEYVTLRARNMGAALSSHLAE